MKRDRKIDPMTTYDDLMWTIAFLQYAMPRERINLQGGTSE